MFKLLSPFALLLIWLAVSDAGTLEWPANLVALSTAKSTQALPMPLPMPMPLPLPASEESAELATESSASAEQQAESNLAEASSASSDPQDARLLSAMPVSVPLPLIVATRAGLRTVLTIQEPTLAQVGNLVEHVPTAISHQSQTVVHDHRRLVTPIVAPAVRTTQVVRQQPHLVWTVASDPRIVLLQN